MVQGRETKTRAWTNLTRAPHAEEALDFIQKSDPQLPATLKETAEALVLTLHSWTRGHTIVLHNKTGPPYARTATCRPSIAATGEAHPEWKPEREDDEYTLVHATRHGHREEKEPTTEPTATPPPRPTARHWILYRQLAHGCTLAEHSIRPYTEVAYVERMLQDWTKYETEVLEGHTGPPGATSRTTWDDIVPDGDIGALATTVRATFGDSSRPDHPFGDNRNPAITNAILAYHSWCTQQSIRLHTPHDDAREWHPIGPPALEFYLHEDAATGAHNITSLRPTMPQPIPEPHIPPSPTKPQTPTRHEHRPPQQGHSPAAHEKAEPPNATTTVQQLDKPLTLRHVPDNYQLPRGGNHTRSTATTWRLPTGTTDWKKVLPRIATMASMRLLTPHQVHLPHATHLFLTTQGTATMEGTALDEDDQTPQARPTQAIWITAATGTDITVDPDPEWMAIHYTLDCTKDAPTLTEWQTRWAAEANRLHEVALDDTLTPQTMEPAGRTAQAHRDPTKHTLWHYPTTIHPEAVTQIKETLSLTLPDTHNAHQPGKFTVYWNFPTDTGMVPQVPAPPLPPTVTALAKAAQAMAHREGAPQDWTPNVLVEQRTHHNANKAQQAGRQIHPPLHDKDGNLQPHSPWMVHFILEDHGDKRKGTEVQITHALAHTHLNYTVPTSNALVTYGEARKPTYRLQADTEGTAYTVYTWARYGDLPAPIWHPDPSWHEPLHGGRVPRQSVKPAGNTAAGTHDNPPPLNIINSALANARMPLIDTGCPTPDDTTHRRTWGTIRRTLHHDIDRDQATWIDRGSVSIRVGGWLNTLSSNKLRRVAGPYILYPVPHGMDGPCPGLQPGDPPCGHPCPHALSQPLPPQPAPLPGIYLNTITGARTSRRATPQAKPSLSIRYTTWPWGHDYPTPTNRGTR